MGDFAAMEDGRFTFHSIVCRGYK